MALNTTVILILHMLSRYYAMSTFLYIENDFHEKLIS